MAPWGAYFASYVKKNDSKGQPQVQEASDKPSPFVIKPYKAEFNIDSSQDSFGLKRSDTRIKKLYSSPSESTTSLNELPQRSNSNAARVAKLFGYANSAPTPAFADVVSKAVQVAKEETKQERDAGPVVVNAPMRSAVKPIQTRKDSKFDDEVQSPPKLRDPSMQLKVDVSQLEPEIAVRREQPPAMVQEKARVVKVAKPSISSLDDIMSLLEDETFTSSPVEMKKEVLDLTRKDTGKKVKAGKSSLSSLDEMMSVLENEAFMPRQARRSLETDNEKTVARGSMAKERVKKVKAGNPSLSSLDEMMSSLEQDWNVGSLDRKASITGQRSPPPSQELGASPREAQQTRVDVEASSSTYRENFVASPVSFISLQSNPFVDTPRDTQAQMEEEMESTEKPLLEYMKEAEEMRLEREQMESERQRILEEERAFQEEADRFAQEEEQMRRFVENLKLEEERDFENQERKRRIAEEKRRKEEEERREEEEERKRLQELEEERLAIETAELLNRENEKIENDRREREARMFQERVEMERARYVEEEARLKAQRMEDDRIAKEEEEREEQLKHDEVEARLEAQRLEDEEMAEQERREEEERAKRERYKEENRRFDEEQATKDYWRAARENAERLRQEKKDAQRESRRREEERIAQEQRRAERERIQRREYEEDQRVLEAQRREHERIERKRYEEEEDFEPEVLTKEQEMQKAEEKIRAAFAGLAQERDQISSGVKPAGSGSRPEAAGLDAGRQERGVSRYNTVGGAARPRQEQPVGVSRVKTAGVRQNKSIGGGLPSGPKAGGFGLPGRPNAGLPSGPRPRGKV